MRVSFFLFLFFTALVVLGWAFLSGWVLGVFYFLLVTGLLVFINATDKILLLLLGSREIKFEYEEELTNRVAQIAYKLGIRPPKLYFYNGVLDRAFILQCGQRISLVYSKNLLDICSDEEVEAVSFELLIQAKNNLARKRSLTLGIIGIVSWISQGFVGSIKKMIPSKRVGEVLNWLIYYAIHPWFMVAFRLMFGWSSLRKVNAQLASYESEAILIDHVKRKINYPDDLYSLPMKKFIELTLINKNPHFQNVLALEFLPHEWDIKT